MPSSRRVVRNLVGFRRFLESASFSQGAVLNIQAVSSDSGVNRKTVENHFDLLEDLLIATRLQVFSRRARRKLTAHPKFYFFDAGVYRTIRPRGPLDVAEEIDGPAFETLVMQSLRAENANHGLDYELYFWRTSDGTEVDFVLYGPRGLHAIEVKRSARFAESDLAGLRAFGTDYPESKGWFLYLEAGGDLGGGAESDAEAIPPVAQRALVRLRDVERNTRSGAFELVCKRGIASSKRWKQRSERAKQVDGAVIGIEGHEVGFLSRSPGQTRRDRDARCATTDRVLAGGPRARQGPVRGGGAREGIHRMSETPMTAASTGARAGAPIVQRRALATSVRGESARDIAESDALATAEASDDRAGGAEERAVATAAAAQSRLPPTDADSVSASASAPASGSASDSDSVSASRNRNAEKTNGPEW